MTLQELIQQGARTWCVQLALLSPLLLTQCEQEPATSDNSPVGAGPGGALAGQAGASAEGGAGAVADAGSAVPPAASGDSGIPPGPVGSGSTAGGTTAAGADASADASRGVADAGPPLADAQADAAQASSGAFPAVSDFKRPGPFTPTRADGPSGYVLFYPKELGKEGM